MKSNIAIEFGILSGIIIISYSLAFLMKKYKILKFIASPLIFFFTKSKNDNSVKKNIIFILNIITFHIILWFSLTIFAAIWKWNLYKNADVFIIASLLSILLMFVRIFAYFMHRRSLIFFSFIIAILIAVDNIAKKSAIRIFLENFEIDLIVLKFKFIEFLIILASIFGIYFGNILWIKLIKSFLLKSVINANDRSIYKKLLIYFGFVISIFVFLSVIGIKGTNIAVFTGSIGIGIGLGMQKIASNFISGLTLMMEKKIKVGDLIILPNFHQEMGYVRKIDIRSTVIENFDGENIIVPNEYLSNDIFKNKTLYNREGKEKIVFYLKNSNDLRKAINLAVEVGKSYKYCTKNPDKTPNCRIDDIVPIGYKLGLRFWLDDLDTDEIDLWVAKSDITILLQKAFDKEKIAMTFFEDKESGKIAITT